MRLELPPETPVDLARRFGRTIGMLAIRHRIGTIGLRALGGPHYSWLDSCYMTLITIATIGYAEVIDLSANPAGRVFAVAIAIVGVANT